MGAVVGLGELQGIQDFAGRNRLKTCFTYGCYDLLHAGHIKHFRVCREIIGPNCLLIVGVKSDRIVRRLKGEDRPFVPEGVRAAAVAAVPDVDFALVCEVEGVDSWTALSMLRNLRPDYNIVAQDAPLLGFRQAVCERYSIELITPSRIPPDGNNRVSTSELLKIA